MSKLRMAMNEQEKYEVADHEVQRKRLVTKRTCTTKQDHTFYLAVL